MPGQRQMASDKPYLRIVAGNLVQKVPEGTEGARIRKWETPDGNKGETVEIVYQNWTGKVIDVRITTSDFGDQCIIELDDAYITLPVTGRYFPDFAQKIHSADLSKPIKFHPYDMEVDGKKKSGISMQQGTGDGSKLKNYFYDGEKNLHGFPEPDFEKAAKRKSYWKGYFLEVADFLIDKFDDLEFPQEEMTEDEPSSDDTKKGAVVQSKEDLLKEMSDAEVPTDLPFDK